MYAIEHLGRVRARYVYMYVCIYLCVYAQSCIHMSIHT